MIPIAHSESGRLCGISLVKQEGEEVMLKVKLRVRGPLPTQEKVRHSETAN